MSKLIIGVDPDSKAHGVAIYHDKKLVKLECLTLMQIHELLHKDYWNENVIFAIENVAAKKTTFNKTFVSNPRANTRVSNSVGMCQQAQIELERMLDYLGFRYIHCSISNNWKSQAGKKQFEIATGWKGRSNEDTRSAAWMGYKLLIK